MDIVSDELDRPTVFSSTSGSTTIQKLKVHSQVGRVEIELRQQCLQYGVRYIDGDTNYEKGNILEKPENAGEFLNFCLQIANPLRNPF